jgi:hypothetical protein
MSSCMMNWKGAVAALLFSYSMSAQVPSEGYSTRRFAVPPGTPQIGLQYDNPKWHRYSIHKAINPEELGDIASYVSSRPIIGGPTGMLIGPQENLYGFDKDGDHKIETRMLVVNGTAKSLEIDLNSPRGKDILKELGSRVREITPPKPQKRPPVTGKSA